MRRLLLVVALVAAACGGDVSDAADVASDSATSNTTVAESTTETTTAPETTTTVAPAATPTSFDAAPALTIDPAGTYTATVSTNLGDVVIELFAESAPMTVNNFVFLAEQGFYNGVIFHRVIPGFMAQGGDPTGTGRGGPGYQFNDELNAPQPYNRGIVAMANAGPNTNGSQFFIMGSDVGLPYAYSIFGNVTSGIEVIDAMMEIPTEAGDRPTEDIVINSVAIAGP